MQVGKPHGENYIQIWGGGGGERKEIATYGNDYIVLVDDTL